jgi:hypothetical protein
VLEQVAADGDLSQLTANSKATIESSKYRGPGGTDVSPHQAVAVAVRIFAVWLATYLTRTSPFFAVSFNGHDSSDIVLATAVITAVGFGVAAALWFFPLAIARKLLPPAAAAPAPAQPPEVWLSMGCALIGLWMLASSISTLARNAFALYYVDRSYGTEIPTEIKHGMVYSVLNVAIGVWLILGARGFSKVLRWAQNVGLHRPSN